MCQDYELCMFLNFSDQQVHILTASVNKLSKILKWFDDNTTLIMERFDANNIGCIKVHNFLPQLYFYINMPL
jgi:nucleosome binding factor SPN SPT16 subunit